MTLKQLEYFNAVAETGSFSAAARELHVAQPPVSRQISTLEEELGAQLFLRHNKGVSLTEAGKCLFQQAQQTFQSLRVMADRVRDINAGLQGHLRLGVIFSDVPLALGFLGEYHTLYPQVELFIRQGTPADLLAELEKGRLHVLFLRSREEGFPGFRERILGEDPLELVMRADTDPAPGQQEIPMDALREVPMCLLRGDDLWGYSDRLTSACQKAGFSPKIICQCYDTPMALQLVAAGFGVSFLPRSVVTAQLSPGLYAKPVQGLHAMSSPALVWSADPYYPTCVQRFLNLADPLKRSQASALGPLK